MTLLDGDAPYLVVGLLLVAWVVVERMAMTRPLDLDERGGR